MITIVKLKLLNDDLLQEIRKEKLTEDGEMCFYFTSPSIASAWIDFFDSVTEKPIKWEQSEIQVYENAGEVIANIIHGFKENNLI